MPTAVTKKDEQTEINLEDCRIWRIKAPVLILLFPASQTDHNNHHFVKCFTV